MTEQQEQTPDLPIPRNDDEVFRRLKAFPIALAKAIGAMIQMDQIITVHEYEALARAAENLENLTPLPNLMSALVLKAVLEDASLDTSLRDLRTLTQDLSEPERTAVFHAIQPIIQLQGKHSDSLAMEWAHALRLQDSTSHSVAGKIKTSLNSLLSSFTSVKLFNESLAQKAQHFARMYSDHQLETMASKVLSGDNLVSEEALRDELTAAVERVFRNTSSVLKPQKILDEQVEIAQRFLKIADALREQIRLRLLSIKNRLTLQNQMFEEDIDDFVKNNANAVELGMRDLMEDRTNWADETIWEQFSHREAFQIIREDFQRLKNRYERIFDLWQKELDLFAQEAVVIRTGILTNIDPCIFQGLLSTPHPTVSLRNKLDNLANLTLGTLGSGTLLLALMGKSAVVISVVATPFGHAIALLGLATIAWKIISNPQARKRKMVQKNRQVLEEKLTQLLKEKGYDHKNLSNDIMNRFIQAADDHYTPLIIDARMTALRANLEAEIVKRVLSDTRKVLLSSR